MYLPGGNADADPPEDNLGVLALVEHVELLHLDELGDGEGVSLQQARQERLRLIGQSGAELGPHWTIRNRSGLNDSVGTRIRVQIPIRKDPEVLKFGLSKAP